MPESDFNRTQRRLIRTIAKEAAYEVLFEHLEEYEHKSKKAKEEHGKR
ncbi:MAG: hypothetical protein NWE95_06940 [Candidatus Bathyarchaeota archaeon]|nr:hypothetical protein [Candidatus Bathyarchaeota archaeon]